MEDESLYQEAKQKNADIPTDRTQERDTSMFFRAKVSYKKKLLRFAEKPALQRELRISGNTICNDDGDFGAPWNTLGKKKRCITLSVPPF